MDTNTHEVILMIDILIIILLLGIAAAIIFFLVREKKRGNACIGCPHAKACAKKRAGGCGCGQDESK
ncbi:MAG: FeoB-associated Cys-rich membrane protein [Ruminococcaceae bacterium]|nr:FeoB-associated Cys-rich membrane protein [Oscillospiraceae bacterium]